MSSDTFTRLQQRFDPAAAQGMSAVFQFHFSDADSHFLVIEDGALAIHAGEHAAPSVTLTLSTDTLKGLLKGTVNGMSAFMTGKLKATGDLLLATRLTSLFPSGVA